MHSGRASGKASARQLDAALADKLFKALVSRLDDAGLLPTRQPGPQQQNSGTVKIDSQDASRSAGSAANTDVSIGLTTRRLESLEGTQVPAVVAESETVKQLQAEMVNMRTEFELSRAQPGAASHTRNAGPPLRLSEVGKLKISQRQPPPPGQAVTVRILLEGAPSKSPVAAASQIEHLKAPHRETPAVNVEDDAQLTRDYSALFLAHNKIETALETATEEKQSLTKRIKDLERQCKQAQAEAEELRQTLEHERSILSQEDPLLFLMRTKVTLQHQIAVNSNWLGPDSTARRLHNDNPQTLEAAAVYTAHSARQQYFALRDRLHPGRTTWLVEGRRLDPVSEEKLRRREENKVGELERELMRLERSRKENQR